MLKFNPTMWPYRAPVDHDMNKLFHTKFQWLLRRFLKDSNKFSIILIYFPLKEGVVLHFINKLEPPSPVNLFCQVWLKSACGSGQEVENVKGFQTYIQTDGQTERRTPDKKDQNSSRTSA